MVSPQITFDRSSEPVASGWRLALPVLHRLAFRAAQGVLIYWVAWALLDRGTAVPERLDLAISLGFVFILMVLPRPRVVGTERAPRGGFGAVLRFLI